MNSELAQPHVIISQGSKGKTASDPKHVFQGRQVLLYGIKLSTNIFHETISLFLCSLFIILFDLNRANLNESRKDRELEGSNQYHAKALGERPTSGAGRPRIARPACTCGRSLWPFYRCAGSVCNAPGKLLRSIGWKVQAGRPGVVRPA